MKRKTAETLFHQATRKHDPIDLAGLPFEQRLSILLGGNDKAAASIAEFTGGDLRKLTGMELADLEGIPGVGRATAVRLFTFFSLVADLLGATEEAA